MTDHGVSFVGREDRDLRPTLEHDPAHQAAVLAWLVRGAVRYYAEGLHAPATIAEATAAYEHESDPLADFFTEAIEPAPESEVWASDLYGHYCEWARQHGLSDRERMTATAFGRRVGDRLHWRRTNGRKVYLDIARRLP